MSWLHFLPDGKGGFFVESNEGGGGGAILFALGLAALFICSVTFYFVSKLIGTAFFLPLAALLICGIIALSFYTVLNPLGLFLFCLYFYESCFIYQTENSE